MFKQSAAILGHRVVRPSFLVRSHHLANLKNAAIPDQRNVRPHEGPKTLKDGSVGVIHLQGHESATLANPMQRGFLNDLELQQNRWMKEEKKNQDDLGSLNKQIIMSAGGKCGKDGDKKKKEAEEKKKCAELAQKKKCEEAAKKAEAEKKKKEQEKKCKEMAEKEKCGKKDKEADKKKKEAAKCKEMAEKEKCAKLAEKEKCAKLAKEEKAKKGGDKCKK